jgi:hypothetical protein
MPLPRLTRKRWRRKGYDALSIVLSERERRQLLGSIVRITAHHLQLAAAGDLSLVAGAGLDTASSLGPCALAYIVEGAMRRDPRLDRDVVLRALRSRDRPERWFPRGPVRTAMQSTGVGDALLKLFESYSVF